MTRFAEPVFTRVLPNVAALRPPPGCFYISGASVEERSEHVVTWEQSCDDVTFARLERADRTAASFSIGSDRVDIWLRSTESVAAFLGHTECGGFYLDLTGLPHHVWAPLLKGLLLRGRPLSCVYVEPGDYRFSAAPTEAAIFDLSERIDGIAPLPGFASFPAAVGEDPLFVPLLGFEGTRFAYMLEDLQPKREDVMPVVGVPGFRPEYPFYTYIGNRTKLLETRSWQNVRFAAANCPFSVYNLLGELAEGWPARRMVVAAIGTKPHALGAVLYCLRNPRRIELLYDHPVRKAERTSGTSRVCVYDLSLFATVGAAGNAEQ